MENECFSSPTSKFAKFNDYEVRLQTFAGWINNKDPHDFVKSGFFFVGGRDTVQCFHCGIILNSWGFSDNIDFRHIQNSEDCDYMKRKRTLLVEKTSMGLSTLVLSELKEINDRLTSIEKTIFLPKKCESSTAQPMEYRLFGDIDVKSEW